MRAFFSLLMLCALAGGCARYEYVLVHPQEPAQTIGRDRPVEFYQEPLHYWLITADGRLVMRIDNPTDEVVLLVGPESYIVDPQGQSHPIASRPIAPGSYVRLIHPPMRPEVLRTGPSVGFGVGMGVGAGRVRPGAGVGVGTGPRRTYITDPGDATFWEWRDEGTAQMVFRFEQNGRRFQHEFVFERRRAR